MAGRTVTEDGFLYPSSDHMPKADSDLHRRLLTDLIAKLDTRYADRTDVYVSGNLRVYCEPWNPYDVTEYYYFDPLRTSGRPPLEGFRRVGDDYVNIAAQDGGLVSRRLGLILVPNDVDLDLFDADTGSKLLSAAEALTIAEAELARLRAELEPLRQPPTSDA